MYELFITDRRYFRKLSVLYAILFLGLALNSSKAEPLKDGHFTLGNAFIRKGDFKKARQEFNQALGLGEPYRSRIFFQLGNIEFEEKKFSNAADFLLRTIESNEQLTAQVDEFLTTSLFIPPLFPIKFLHPEQKLNLEPLAAVFFNIGNKYSLWKEFEAAEISYRKSLALKEEARTNLNLGNVLGITSPGDAPTYYQRAIKLDSRLSSAYFNLAQELKKQNKLKDAVILFEKAAALANNKQEREIINQNIREQENRLRR